MAATLTCVFGVRIIRSQFPRISQCRQSSSGDKTGKPHPEAPQFPSEQTGDVRKGKIYDKKPFKMELQAEKNYHWCVCGTSKHQPVCDGSHKQLEKTTGYKWRPLRFQVETTKEYWMCNCKQTSKPPFCDGTHKQPHIQAAIK